MARKKSHHQDQIQPTAVAAMDDVSEKLDSLKSLNAMLLKETVERRQQVDSLLQSNGSLESELARVEAEKDRIQAELTRLSDFAVVLEMERAFAAEFVSVQMNQRAEDSERERDAFRRDKAEMEERLLSSEGEMERLLRQMSEIDRVRIENESEIESLRCRLDEVLVEIEKERGVSAQVSRERDEVRARLDAQTEEADRLAVKLVEAEKMGMEILEQVRKLQVEYDAVVEEKQASVRMIQVLGMDKDKLERDLLESNSVIEQMMIDIREIGREKDAIEAEMNVRERMNGDLVLHLQAEGEATLLKLAEWEKRYAESSEKQLEMQGEIEVLMGEYKEKERSCECLTVEVNLAKKDLDEALKIVDQQKVTLEQITREKIEIEDAKRQGESHIVELKKELGEYKETITSLEKSNADHIEKIKQLGSQVSKQKAEFDHLTTEMNETRACLDQERIDGGKLRGKVSELGKEMEVLHKELAKIKGENEVLNGDKNELKARCVKLSEELISVETKLANSQKEVVDMKAKLGLAETNSKLVLDMLKSTASSMIALSKEDVSDLNDDGTALDKENGVGEEMKQHATELEAIKKAFKNRDSKVEEMKRQLEFLQASAAEAHKGKSFWTLVSTATTVLAAGALAYVAKGH